ncbi:MAG: tRNA (adenosine(37)-N6)-threonylcarbamoyltransferase complex ATPase subunit type 1 TsaE [Candidatus Eremiobacteraeota bacterium]|nr:tRNA (adenosine(37)-N6)-threonylcarbamoyltransferase complex ATPase subunit type 1 TsaE [Candidatus Eremiobacteraeota bacterium]MBV9263263.1 tRNA (adenosine(37)-N6)-threonylcarbamoyltransferase complex ATPase subunit type 1 TsaE [Candidatus Eremiobacteraeota bacterium]
MRKRLATLADFTAFAAEFSRRLRPGDVVALSGALGSGKTTFIDAVVRSLHATGASSPTFTFWHHYAGDPPIDHLDFFRIRDPRELTELGLEEAFDGRSIVLVEWWRNAAAILPVHRYEIEIVGCGEEPRLVTLRQA